MVLDPLVLSNGAKIIVERGQFLKLKQQENRITTRQRVKGKYCSSVTAHNELKRNVVSHKALISLMRVCSPMLMSTLDTCC